MVLELAREKSATRTDRLAVAIPSHCPLLDEAFRIVAGVFRDIRLRRSSIAYLSGCNGRVLWKPECIADDLLFNMARLLHWADAMTTAYGRGVRLMVEMPQGSVLTGLATDYGIGRSHRLPATTVVNRSGTGEAAENRLTKSTGPSADGMTGRHARLCHEYKNIRIPFMAFRKTSATICFLLYFSASRHQTH